MHCTITSYKYLNDTISMTNTTYNMDLDSICASLSCVVSKRSHYQRLDNGGDRRKVKMIWARRSGTRSARRFWRIKAIPKLRRLKMASPFKLLKKLKNAYINMMVSFSENLGYVSATNVHLAPKRVPMGGQVESRFVFEIYKALKASQELGAVQLAYGPEEKCRFGLSRSEVRLRLKSHDLSC